MGRRRRRWMWRWRRTWTQDLEDEEEEECLRRQRRMWRWRRNGIAAMPHILSNDDLSSMHIPNKNASPLVTFCLFVKDFKSKRPFDAARHVFLQLGPPTACARGCCAPQVQGR
jgi:hypothetical protein